MNADTRSYFLTLMRIFFGGWLTYLGVMKWINGPAGFVGYIVADFEKTWAPAWLLVPTAWAILVAEVVVGVWILLGKAPRLAWSAATLLMFGLLFGKTMTGDFATVANNWQYLVLCALVAALHQPESKR